MSEAILQTQELTRRYGHTLALDRASITVEKGQIFGLVGRNGAGKTTLIRLISGQSIPTSGQISLFGQTSDSGLNRARSLTGAMVEIPSFYPYLTARQNLEYYRIQRGIPGKNCVDEALELVNLTDTGKKKFKTFSLGMKQRLGLALALMNQPEFLLLDEPINGLDPEGIVEFRELLLRLNRERQTTILISPATSSPSCPPWPPTSVSSKRARCWRPSPGPTCGKSAGSAWSSPWTMRPGLPGFWSSSWAPGITRCSPATSCGCTPSWTPPRPSTAPFWSRAWVSSPPSRRTATWRTTSSI